MTDWQELIWLLKRRALARRLYGDEYDVTLGAKEEPKGIYPLVPPATPRAQRKAEPTGLTTGEQ
jgi:hypothetical protein